MTLPPQIIVKGGKDLDGTWGSVKTFSREFQFELINVPLPIFMLSPFIPPYNSLHPLYPFAIAKDSRCTRIAETAVGRMVTISTNYQILKPAVPLRSLSGFDSAAVIAGNMPFLLPAQDVSYEPVAVEERLDNLYIEKTKKEIKVEGEYKFKKIPFQTTAGTKLTGTQTRNILKMTFWYLADPAFFAEAELEKNYTGVVNELPVNIAGRHFDAGRVKIESIEFEDNVWERENLDHLSMKIIRVSLLIDKNTWCKEYENVSTLFTAYPYLWQNASQGEKKNIKMMIDLETSQPKYYTHFDKESNRYFDNTYPKEELPLTAKRLQADLQRIFCTMYDPDPENEGDSEDPIFVQNPQKAIQFFGTREDCFRLNPDSEPTEISEPMYLDENGFMLYPDPATGKVDIELSPTVKGYIFKPVDFSPLHFPAT